jgi:hypothetical protein
MLLLDAFGPAAEQCLFAHSTQDRQMPTDYFFCHRHILREPAAV